MPGAGQDPVLLGAHRPDHRIETVELHIEHSAHQFGGARADTGEGLRGVVAALPVEVARIDVAAGALGHFRVAGGDAAAFAAAHVLEEIEAERGSVAEGAKLAALIGPADALADVLEHQKAALLGDRHDRIHVAGGTPHVDRNDGARMRADRVAYGRGADGEALVDVDDHRNGADRQHRRGRRHIGVGRNQHLVARADAETDKPGGKAIGAARSKRELADAEMLGIALLEALAFAVVAVAEQLARADHPCDRLDLFLAGQIHGISPSDGWVRLMHRTPCDVEEPLGAQIGATHCPTSW